MLKGFVQKYVFLVIQIESSSLNTSEKMKKLVSEYQNDQMHHPSHTCWIEFQELILNIGNQLMLN